MSKLSRTARYYRKSKKGRAKHNEYQKKYNKKKSQVKRRVDNKKNREFGTYETTTVKMFLTKEIKLF